MKYPILGSAFFVFGLLVASSLDAATRQFEFINKTKLVVSVSVGSKVKPPDISELKALAPLEKIEEKENPPVEDPQLLIKMPNGDQFTYKITEATGKNIRLKMTTTKNVSKLETQFGTYNNIKDANIVLISRELNGQGLEIIGAPEEPVEKKPSEEPVKGEEPAKEDPEDEPAKKDDDTPKKKLSIDEYQLFDVKKKTSLLDSDIRKILGLSPSSLLVVEAKKKIWSAKVEKAQQDLNEAYEAQIEEWPAGSVTDKAKEILVKNKVTEEADQEKLAKAAHLLIKKTYEKLKTQFAKNPSSEDTDW